MCHLVSLSYINAEYQYSVFNFVLFTSDVRVQFWDIERASEVRYPAGANDFSSSLCVQTGSVSHPASVQWVQGDISPGIKRGRVVTLTTHHQLVPRSRTSRSYTSSSPCATMVWSGTAVYSLYHFSLTIRLLELPVNKTILLTKITC
jgi:hypothetical protein